MQRKSKKRTELDKFCEFVDLVLSDQNRRIAEIEKKLKGLVKRRRRGAR